MRKLTLLVSLFTLAILILSCGKNKNSFNRGEVIKSYCLDFNWGEGGPNGFAEPGLWADANPQEHIKWYKALGVNIVQTFLIGIIAFAFGLFITRLFDPQITRATKKIVTILSKRRKLRDLIMKYF